MVFASCCAEVDLEVGVDIVNFESVRVRGAVPTSMQVALRITLENSALSIFRSMSYWG